MIALFFAALSLVASVWSAPLGLERRTQSLSPCFLNCTTVALTTGCSGIADLSCLCNSQVFHNVLSTCVHQVCPDEDDATAQFQEQECSDYTTLSLTNSNFPSSPTSTLMSILSTPSSPPVNEDATVAEVSATSLPYASSLFNQLTGTATTGDDSARTAIIIGSIIGFIVLVMLAFFIAWWYKEGHYNASPLVNKVNRMSFNTEMEGHAYGEQDGVVAPWVYPTPPSSRREPSSSASGTIPRAHPFIAIASASSKPPLPSDLLDPHLGGSPRGARADQIATIEPFTLYTPLLRTAKSDGANLKLPPPAYRFSSGNRRYLTRRPSSNEL